MRARRACCFSRLPSAVVYVHEKGAPHMADPAKLLASADAAVRRQHGSLLGRVRPVPVDRMRVLARWRTDRHLRPHAWRWRTRRAMRRTMSAIFDMTTGTAYVGDTAGIRVAKDYVKAPTPPPDIDLEAWEQSLRIIEAWRPRSLVLTHFGQVDDVPDHLRRFRAALWNRSAALVSRDACVRGHRRRTHPTIRRGHARRSSPRAVVRGGRLHRSGSGLRSVLAGAGEVLARKPAERGKPNTVVATAASLLNCQDRSLDLKRRARRGPGEDQVVAGTDHPGVAALTLGAGCGDREMAAPLSVRRDDASAQLGPLLRRTPATRRRLDRRAASRRRRVRASALRPREWGRRTSVRHRSRKRARHAASRLRP